jgi:hypothetical protein
VAVIGKTLSLLEFHVLALVDSYCGFNTVESSSNSRGFHYSDPKHRVIGQKVAAHIFLHLLAIESDRFFHSYVESHKEYLFSA